MRTLSATVVGLVLLVTLGVGAAGAEGASTPDVPVGGDVSYFTGTEECSSQATGSAVVDGVEHFTKHYTCEAVTTDPRFSGTEEMDLIAYLDGASGGRWTAEGVLTQDEGSWRGQALGVWDAGALLLGSPGVTVSYGEATYVGEGAYEGFVLHYYVGGTDEESALMGWITLSE